MPTVSCYKHKGCWMMSELQPINWCARKPVNMDEVSTLLQKSIDTNQFTNNGPLVASLEKYIQEKFGLQKKVHMASSGTAAMHAAVSSLNILHDRPLHYVTQAFTFPSSTLGPLKGTLVVDNDGIHMGPSLKALDTNKDSIDVVIVTNPFGCMVALKVYRDWCNENDKILMFDNAATPMAFVDGINICDVADISIVSFHETKFFGRGEGGAVICSEKMWEIVNRAVNFGFKYGSPVRKFHIEASNWRMCDFMAAFLLSYLKYLFDGNRLENIFHLCGYTIDVIKKSKILSFLFMVPEKTVFSGLCLKTSNTHMADACQDLIHSFSLRGIEAKKYYVPLIPEIDAPVAWNMYKTGLCVPFHLQMTTKDIDRIVQCAEEIFQSD